MRLGKRLKQARLKRKMNQEQLAAAVPGASQAMISALESRDSETTTLLFGFAKALRVSPEWLLDGKGESGLDTPIGRSDVMRDQLMDLYGKLTPRARDKLVTYANGLYSGEHPEPSPENPFGKPTAKPEKVNR